MLHFHSLSSFQFRAFECFLYRINRKYPAVYLTCGHLSYIHGNNIKIFKEKYITNETWWLRLKVKVFLCPAVRSALEISLFSCVVVLLLLRV